MLTDVIKRIGDIQITLGTSGNVSERRPLDPKTFRITPSGVPWQAISDADYVCLSVANGAVLEGNRRPSTEWRAHQALYRQHDWIGGIVHVHSRYATILSTLGAQVRAVHYQLARIADVVPLVPYHTFGTAELAQGVAQAISPGTRAVLLENHGLLVVGTSVDEAMQSAEDVEWTAMIQYQAMLVGEPRVLSHDELEQVREALRYYGQN